MSNRVIKYRCPCDPCTGGIRCEAVDDGTALPVIAWQGRQNRKYCASCVANCRKPAQVLRTIVEVPHMLEVPPELFLYVGDLSSKHKAALTRFVEKFRAGAKEHGNLSSNRKWTRDMLDETVDDAFYRIFQLMSIEGALDDE